MGGAKRESALFKPGNAKRGKWPLVIRFHGASGQVWPGIRNEYWVTLAGQENLNVLQPQAASDQYLSYTYWNAGSGPHCDDAQLFRVMLDAVVASEDINTNRIYISGMSSGGQLVFHTAQALHDRVAAVAPIAASIVTTPDVLSTCNLRRPMPLIGWHCGRSHLEQVDLVMR